jgi:hypothetical protein
MANYHHKTIKKFNLDGDIHDDSAIGRLKIEYIRLLTVEMRISGYVPRIDIDPDFTISYNEKKNCFEFKLSLHGIYIGRKQSECIKAIDGITPIYIPKTKSKESLLEQESQSNQK